MKPLSNSIINYINFSGHRRGVALMLLSVFFFTSNSLLVRVAVDLPGIDGWVVTFFRGFVGLLFITLVFGKSGRFEPTHLVTNPLLILRGLMGGIGIPIYYITIAELGVGRATIINCTYPIFGALFACVFLKESLSLKQFAWMLVSFVGMALVVGIDSFQSGIQFYDALGLLGAVVAGGIIVTIRMLHGSERTPTIYAGQCLFGALIAGVPFAGSDVWISGSMALLLLVVTSVLAAVGQLTMTSAYKDLDIKQGASMQMLLPVTIAGGGALFFGESYQFIELVGAVLILVGCYRVVTGNSGR